MSDPRSHRPASARSGSEEQAFLKAYDPRSFPPVAVTVDVVILTVRQGELSVLLVQHGRSDLARHRAGQAPGAASTLQAVRPVQH